jgi:hypothetical protein
LVASTAFCCLYKLLTIRLTPQELTKMISHKDSPYIRAIGFLYLRFVCEPKNLWSWVRDYAMDSEELTVEMKGGTAMCAMMQCFTGLYTPALVCGPQCFAAAPNASAAVRVCGGQHGRRIHSGEVAWCRPDISRDTTPADPCTSAKRLGKGGLLQRV